VPEQALPPAQALALARDLLARGRPFFAHDVLEAAWKAAPKGERRLWQGLAQVCVGLTHLQRGNPVGGSRLLRRGAARLEEHLAQAALEQEVAVSHGVDVPRVVATARARADAVDAGGPGPDVEL
jgi:hypothetical protein